MIDLPRGRARRQSVLSSLAASVVSIAAAAWIYQVWTYTLPEDVFSPEAVVALAIAAVMCWFGMLSNDGGWGDYLTTAAGRTFAATGFVLLAQYPVAYFFFFTPTPWPIIVGGCVLAAVLAGVFDHLAGRHSKRRAGALLVGFDATASALAEAFPDAFCGVLDEDGTRVPASLRYLGTASRLREAIAETQADRIVLSGAAWRTHIAPAELLRFRDSGIEISDGPDLYEVALSRVPWKARHPVDLLLDSAPNQFRSVAAIQAIYTNVIGLSLLLALAPFFVLVSIAILVLSPGGSVMEKCACVGYQGVPFRLLRFRTRDRDGQLSPIGRLLLAINAANLPCLINVVRGEMALFGPPPVRREFSQALSALMPAYAQRFLIKPGVVGWSQLNLQGLHRADEALRLEYDLYYTKMGSAMLDASMFLRLIFQAAVAWIPRRSPAREMEIA